MSMATMQSGLRYSPRTSTNDGVNNLCGSGLSKLEEPWRMLMMRKRLRIWWTMPIIGGCQVSLSKKESRTKVAKNCMKSLYSQVSVKIFDKVKQSQAKSFVSQSKSIETWGKITKKKALTGILSDNMI